MEFGKHITKGIWAFADKALPAVYALGFIFLVVRVLPEREYGAFALVQSIFLVVSSLGYALALQPLTKFAAENDENGPFIVASLVVNAVFFAVAASAIYLLKSPVAALLDPTGQGNFVRLAGYVPLLLLSSYYRGFAVSLLQAKYQVQKIFWIDAVYFLGTFVLIIIASNVGQFSTAEDMVKLNVYGQGLSSLLAVALTRRQMQVKLEFRREAFRKMWDFGKYAFGSNSIYTLFAQMDVFFVSHYAGVVAVAVYNAAKNLTRIFDMLAQVLQMFLIPLSSKACAQNDHIKLQVTAEKAICFSTLLFLPVLIILFLVPEAVLQFLYGGKYNNAAPILRVFSLLAFIIPWNGVVTSYLTGCGKVKEGFYFILLLIVVALPWYGFLTAAFGGLGPSIGYVSLMAIFTVALIIYIQRIVSIKPLPVVLRIGDAWMFLRNRASK